MTRSSRRRSGSASPRPSSRSPRRRRCSRRQPSADYREQLRRRSKRRSRRASLEDDARADARADPRAGAADRAGSARVYGPAGEHGRVAPLPQAAPRRELCRTSAREVSEALGSLAGPRGSRAPRSPPSGPAAYTLALATDEGRALDPARPPGRPDLVASRSRVRLAALLHGLPRPRRGAACSSSAAARSRSRRSKGCSPRGADVTVVAPEIVPELERARPSTLVRREYRADDLDGRFLVVAATSTTSVNRAVFADAEARSLLCNVVDVPELLLASSSPPSTATSRSRSPSPPAAPRPRSRSGCATRSPPSCGRSTPSSPPAARAAAVGEGALRRPTRSARSTSQGSWREELG